MADDREFLREQVRRLNTVLSRYQKGENSGTLNETTDSVHSSLTPCLTHNKFMAPLLTEYDNIIHELEQQVAHYKNELENLSGRVKELVEENKQLHSELQCQSQLNKEKYKEVEGGVHTSDPLHLSSLTEQDSGTYVQLWKQTCAELEQLQQSDTRKTKELTECKSQLTYTQQALSSAEQRIMELKSQCQELSSQQKHCLQNAHTSEQEVTSTQQQLSKCRSELKATQLKNSDLKQQLDEVAAKLRNMESAASLCKDQEQNLDHKLHSVANTNTELEAKLKICHRECSVLREEKCELESKQTQLENEIETLLHRETKAAIEVKDSMDMLQKILLEKEQMEVQEQQHVLEIERLRKSISVLLEEAGVRTKKEVELVREECNKNIDKMASEIQKMEKQCGYRQGQLDQALREKKSLQCELERALSQVPLEQGRVRATLQDLRTKLSTAEKSHDEVMHKLRDVQFTNKTLQNQLSEEQEQCAELSAELQQMRTEWQSEGGQLREEVTRLTREQDRTLEQLTVMRKKLKATEQTYQHKITATLEEYQAREVVLQARLQATEEISSARVRELQDLVTSQQQRLMKWKEEARALKNMFEATVDKLKSENKLLVGRSRVMMSQLANQEEINNTLSESTLKMEDEVARLQTRLQDTETTADQATRQVAAMLSREKHILAQKRQLQEDIDRLRLQMTRATLPTTKSVFSRTVQNGLSSSTKLLDRPATTSWHPSSSFTGYKHSSSCMIHPASELRAHAISRRLDHTPNLTRDSRIMAGAAPANGVAGPGSEEFIDVAKKVQERILNGDTSAFDEVDIQHVRQNIQYVNMFVRQKFGNEQEAISMMVEALKWRKEFAVNDIKLDQLDRTFFENGLAFPHNEDKQGSTLVILNVHMHKKDSKRTMDLRRFLVFCLESHARRFPGKRVTLIFNMSQCGLSNMDMDFIKFLITCFKCYYPSMLGWLLVFEMPWILQAAWKIIKTWLSEGAVRKIKFVTKYDITEYIAPDQLMKDFGGEDTWTYKFDMDELRRESESVWRKEPNLTTATIGMMANGQGEEEGEGEEDTRNGERRQVRFAAGLPPTRQSRFGGEEEESVYRPCSPKEAQLLRGSAISPNYRRRQVNRLMNMQQSSVDSWTSSSSPQQSLESTGSLSSSLERGGEEDTDGVSMLPFLSLSPFQELLFCGDLTQELYCTLQLTNTSDRIVAYKIKTTAPRRYKVRPNINLIDPMSVTSVQVLLVPGASGEPVSTDKFLIQAYQLEAGASVSNHDLPSTWKTFPRKDIMEVRMKCRHSPDVKLPEPEPHSSDATPPPVSKQRGSSESRTLQLVCAKLDQLTTANAHILSKLTRLWYLQLALLIIIVFVLISIFFVLPHPQPL